MIRQPKYQILPDYTKEIRPLRQAAEGWREKELAASLALSALTSLTWSGDFYLLEARLRQNVARQTSFNMFKQQAGPSLATGTFLFQTWPTLAMPFVGSCAGPSQCILESASSNPQF